MLQSTNLPDKKAGWISGWQLFSKANRLFYSYKLTIGWYQTISWSLLTWIEFRLKRNGYWLKWPNSKNKVSQGAHKTPHNYNLTDLSSRKCKWLSNNWIYPFHSQEWQNSDFSLQYKKGGEERENIHWGNIVQISIQKLLQWKWWAMFSRQCRELILWPGEWKGLFPIGWERAASFINQSQSIVKQNQMNSALDYLQHWL